VLEAPKCVFCRIIAGELEASVVHEDERTLAFLDIQPLTSGHLLVVPRRHASSLAELDPHDGEELFHVAQRAAAALR
jgi:histidine triad (HIT) family protein